jgi:hypothetical protein
VRSEQPTSRISRNRAIFRDRNEGNELHCSTRARVPYLAKENPPLVPALLQPEPNSAPPTPCSLPASANAQPAQGRRELRSPSKLGAAAARLRGPAAEQGRNRRITQPGADKRRPAFRRRLLPPPPSRALRPPSVTAALLRCPLAGESCGQVKCGAERVLCAKLAVHLREVCP